MLGQKIHDPQGIESSQKEIEGLGLLNTVTEFIPEKSTRQVKARVILNHGLLSGAEGLELTGYEIHMGQTGSQENASAFRITETPEGTTDYGDGILNESGTVLGTYMHGLFHNREFCRVFLNALRRRWSLSEDENDITAEKTDEYDKLAKLVRESLDIPAIYRIMQDKT